MAIMLLPGEAIDDHGEVARFRIEGRKVGKQGIGREGGIIFNAGKPKYNL